MVAALMFGMIALVFYVIYESVYAEEKEQKDQFHENLNKKE